MWLLKFINSWNRSIFKSKNEWKDLLSEETFKITRDSGTEPPFAGKYVNEKSNGIYHCICCESKLFSSNTKFNSGTGWPSFFEPINKNNITEKIDLSYGMKRIEVICSTCDSHLGHVFEDGPEPTGKRYCNNGVCLVFKPKSWKVIHAPYKCFEYNQ